MDKENVIDFNELKNKIRDEDDVEKLEKYIARIYNKFQGGMFDLNEYANEINKYMAENNISEERLYEIQKKMMGKHGFNEEQIIDSMQRLGLDFDVLKSQAGYETMRKKISFQEKYNKKTLKKFILEYEINNSLNEIKILLDEKDVLIVSEKNIDLGDNELNEFLCSYKKTINDEKLNIRFCQKTNSYEY